MKRILEVQQNLKAPKNQKNKFGGYSYRSAEDIIEAVKPLLHDKGLLMCITDEITQTDARIYVKATVSIYDTETNKEIIKTAAFARESAVKKGMDDSQITGSASSYARKYALNGMFAIDDTKDADSNEQQTQSNAVKLSPEIIDEWRNAIEGAANKTALTKLWNEMGNDLRTELTEDVKKKGKEFK